MNYQQLKNRAQQRWQEQNREEKTRILIGMGTCGLAAGASAVYETLATECQKLDLAVDIVSVGCIGLCYAEPLVEVALPGKSGVFYGNVTPELIVEIIRDHIVAGKPRADLALGGRDDAHKGIPSLFSLPVLKSQVRVVLRNCGNIDPTEIDQYIVSGGYAGIARALNQTPDEVIAEIKQSGLRGRGGAGFSTGLKWQFCRDAAGSNKYIICNADEGDPGAFMDRAVLEGDPHAIMEGMLIGAYAIDAREGYIYVRAEYPMAIARLRTAIDQMRDYGLLGKGILGADFSFDVKIKEGAGAFVCGEETALMASIEGKRGMPRSRPPFPAQAGLWGRPTNINNVETWASVSAIMARGADWYAGYGTELSKGTKTFSLVGKVKRPGLIEVPLGITLREIIYGIGGGIADDREFKAVQTGGPSGGCLPASLLDLSVDFESLAEAGSIVGSGGMVVMDTSTCMVDVARYFLTFTQSESCGKCVLCRLGTKQMLDILNDIVAGHGRKDDIELLLELGASIGDGSLCALGKTAPNPVLTTIRYFRDEYEAHIREKRCPALACKELVTYQIDADKCKGCGLCAEACPVDAISGEKKQPYIIDQASCIKCGSCKTVCPVKVGAVMVVSGQSTLVAETAAAAAD